MLSLKEVWVWCVCLRVYECLDSGFVYTGECVGSMCVYVYFWVYVCMCIYLCEYICLGNVCVLVWVRECKCISECMYIYIYMSIFW